MNSKDLKIQYTEARKLERRIKLLEELKKTIQAMNKLNSAYDLNEILTNKPSFNDDFYNELNKVIDNLNAI